MSWYGSSVETAAVLVVRSVNANVPWLPAVNLDVTPDSNAVCVALEEMLPPILVASNITVGGVLGSNGVVRWGPFFGTNAQALAYQATGLAGIYPVKARWSENGIGAETAATNLVLTRIGGDQFPVPPAVLPPVVLSPASASNLPVAVTITCADTQVQIYFTTDGTTPTTGSTLYATPLSVSTPTVLRARSFRSGYAPSAAAAGIYDQSVPDRGLTLVRSIAGNGTYQPIISITATPSGAATCYSVTEALSPWLTPYDIMENGYWNPTNGTLRWGPFFGGSRVLDYKVNGASGTYGLNGSGSLDGLPVAVSGPSLVTLDLSTMPRLATPVMSPVPNGVFPVDVTITCSTPEAVIHYTLDGSTPDETSPVYGGPVRLTTITELKAIALKTWSKPSSVAVVLYGEEPAPSGVLITRTITGSGSVAPRVRVDVQPAPGVRCYSVTEQLPPGLLAAEITGSGVFKASSHTLRWGPFLDAQARSFTFRVSGVDGAYALSGFASFDGFTFNTTGDQELVLNSQAYLAHSVASNWTHQLSVTVAAMPPARTSCYIVEEYVPTGVTVTNISSGGVWLTNIFYPDKAPTTPMTSIKWGPFLDAVPRAFSYEPHSAYVTWVAIGRISVDGVGYTVTGDTIPVIGLPAPTNVVALAGNRTIYLGWEDSGHEAGFKVYYWTQTNHADEKVDHVGLPAANFFALTGVTNNATYYLAMTAYDAQGVESARSATVSARPVATAGYFGQVSFDATNYPTVTNLAIITLVDADLNADPGVAEAAQVWITSDTDTNGFALLLIETGTHTGVFSTTAARTNLSFSFTASDPAKAELLVKEGDRIVAIYADALPVGTREAQAQFSQYDSDADGIPDWWERVNFGGLNAAGTNTDSDGDRASDFAEYMAGTNPRDPNSVLKSTMSVRGIQFPVELEWPSENGRVYAIEKCNDFREGFYLLISGLPASPPLNTYLDVNAPGTPQVFYRIRVQ